jgi:selenocysteine-specific elongation factor
VARILDYLCDEGSLVRLGKHVVLAQEAMRQAQELVVKHIETHGQLDSADFKYSINSSRKYALAILDFLDARQVTVRFGNDRKLTANFRERLL